MSAIFPTEYAEARALRMAEASHRFFLNKRERECRRVALEHVQEAGRWREVDEPERVRQRLRFRGDAESVAYLDRNGELPPEVAEAIHRPKLAAAIIEEPDAVLPPLGARMGGNELLPSTFLVGGASARRTVALVRTNYGAPIGTGFLVGPQLLMTNHHVLPTYDVARRAEAQFDVVAPGIERLREQCHRLDPATFYFSNKRLDYALVGIEGVSLEGEDLADRGWTTLLGTSGKALVGEPVNIIQHPGGNEQKVALRDNAICDILDDFLHYRADTQRGSSGAPVWSDDWRLVALHCGGIGPLNDYGAIQMRNGEPWNGSMETEHLVAWIANEGVRISRVVQDLRAASATMDAASQRRLAACLAGADEVEPPDPDPPAPPRPNTNDATLELGSWSTLDAFG